MSQRPDDSAGHSITLFDVGHGAEMQERLAGLVAPIGIEIEVCATAEEFLEKRSRRVSEAGCLLLDVHVPGMSGLELQQELHDRSDGIPVIFVAAAAAIPTVVQAIQSGALDFIVAPVDELYLLQRIQTACESSSRLSAGEIQQQAARHRISRLSKREAQVFQLLALGKNSKEIGNQLGISNPTVSKHRRNAFAKLEISNLIQLAHLAGQTH